MDMTVWTSSHGSDGAVHGIRMLPEALPLALSLTGGYLRRSNASARFADTARMKSFLSMLARVSARMAAFAVWLACFVVCRKRM